MITLPVCLWCRRPCSARRGGSPKRFCCAAHRTAFWSAARRWAERAVVSGLLSVDDLRNGAGEACTLFPGANSPAPVPFSLKNLPPLRPGSTLASSPSCSTTPDRVFRIARRCDVTGQARLMSFGQLGYLPVECGQVETELPPAA